VLPRSRWTQRLGRVASGAICRLGATPLVVRAQQDGSRLLLDARSRTEASALWLGEYEADEIAFLSTCLEPDSVVLDIGANVGLMTTPLARRLHLLGGRGRVIAFEPVPVNAERLRRNVAINHLDGRVDVVELALGETEGRAVMVKEGPAGSSDNALVALTADSEAGGVSAELATADSVLDEFALERVDLVKIDVEGYEVPVLRGARRLLAQHRPIVYGEFHNVLMPKRGHSFLDVWELFEPLGYHCFRFVGRCRIERVERPRYDLGNVVLVPADRVPWLLERLSAGPS